jgi:hypothetical protein
LAGRVARVSGVEVPQAGQPGLVAAQAAVQVGGDLPAVARHRPQADLVQRTVERGILLPRGPAEIGVGPGPKVREAAGVGVALHEDAVDVEAHAAGAGDGRQMHPLPNAKRHVHVDHVQQALMTGVDEELEDRGRAGVVESQGAPAFGSAVGEPLRVGSPRVPAHPGLKGGLGQALEGGHGQLDVGAVAVQLEDAIRWRAGLDGMLLCQRRRGGRREQRRAEPHPEGGMSARGED